MSSLFQRRLAPSPFQEGGHDWTVHHGNPILASDWLAYEHVRKLWPMRQGEVCWGEECFWDRCSYFPPSQEENINPFSLCKRDARDCRCHLDAKRRVKLRTEPIHQEGKPTELQRSRQSGMPQCIVSLSLPSLRVFCRSILTHAIITPWNVLVRKLGSVNALAWEMRNVSAWEMCQHEKNYTHRMSQGQCVFCQGKLGQGPTPGVRCEGSCRGQHKAQYLAHVVAGDSGHPDFPWGRTQNNKSTVARTHFLLWAPRKYCKWDLKERTKEDVSILALPSHSHEWVFMWILCGYPS